MKGDWVRREIHDALNRDDVTIIWVMSGAEDA